MSTNSDISQGYVVNSGQQNFIGSQSHSGSGDNVDGNKNVPANNQTFNFQGANIGGGVAGRDYTGDVTNVIGATSEDKYSDTSELKSLLEELINAINSETELDQDDKNTAINQVKKISEASQKPEDEGLQKKATKAVSLLETIAKGIEPAGKLAIVVSKVIKFLGLTII